MSNDNVAFRLIELYTLIIIAALKNMQIKTKAVLKYDLIIKIWPENLKYYKYDVRSNFYFNELDRYLIYNQ